MSGALLARAERVVADLIRRLAAEAWRSEHDDALRAAIRLRRDLQDAADAAQCHSTNLANARRRLKRAAGSTTKAVA